MFFNSEWELCSLCLVFYGFIYLFYLDLFILTYFIMFDISIGAALKDSSIFKDVQYTVSWMAGFTFFFFYLFFFSSVYDGHEHGLFVDKLDARIRNHDREIEKMCNHHFQGFVDSITELLKVRGEAQKLKVKKKGC